MSNTTKHLSAMLLFLCAIFSTSCGNGPWGRSRAFNNFGGPNGYFPEEFVTDSKKYRRNGLAEVSEDRVGDFYGYFVNEFELDKVKKHDDDDNLLYIVDPTDSVDGSDIFGIWGHLSVYTVKDSTDLAVYLDPVFFQCILVETIES